MFQFINMISVLFPCVFYRKIIWKEETLVFNSAEFRINDSFLELESWTWLEIWIRCLINTENLMEGLIAKTGKLTLSFLTNLPLTVDLMVEVRHPVFKEIEKCEEKNSLFPALIL